LGSCPLALDEDTALGADVHAIDIGASELRSAQRLIDGRTFVKVRAQHLALVEREICIHRRCGRLVSALRRASAEREHPNRRGDGRCGNESQPALANIRADNFSSAHRVLLSTGLRRSSACYEIQASRAVGDHALENSNTRWAGCLKEGGVTHFCSMPQNPHLAAALRPATSPVK